MRSTAIAVFTCICVTSQVTALHRGEWELNELIFFLNNSIFVGKEESLFISRAVFALQVLRENFCFYGQQKPGYKDVAFCSGLWRSLS